MHWFVVEPGTPGLPFPTSFMSLDWCTYPWQKEAPGEVYGARRTYNGDWGLAGRFGNHVCGTAEDFLNGAVYDPDIEPIQYDANGLPTCCNTLCGVGGVSWGGTARVSLKTHIRTYYGISYSGTAKLHPVHTDYMHGGVSWGGSAIDRAIHRVEMMGGISYGGHWPQTYHESASGGVSWGGTAPSLVRHIVSMDGGVSWGGTATVDVRPAPPIWIPYGSASGAGSASLTVDVPTTDLLFIYQCNVGGSINDLKYNGVPLTLYGYTYTFSFGIIIIGVYHAYGTGSPASIVGTGIGGYNTIIATGVRGAAPYTPLSVHQAQGTGTTPYIDSLSAVPNNQGIFVGTCFVSNDAGSPTYGSPLPLTLGQVQPVAGGGGWTLYEGYWCASEQFLAPIVTQMTGSPGQWLGVQPYAQ